MHLLTCLVVSEGLYVGNSHEMSRTRLQLQEAVAGKSIAEDLNSSLQVRQCMCRHLLYRVSLQDVICNVICDT